MSPVGHVTASLARPRQKL